MVDKITAPGVIARKGGDKIKMVTAYDTPSARIADRAGADIILVGDSMGNVVLGRADTLSVTVDDMIHHTAAVAAASPRAMVLGDMPWLSYHASTEETVTNAGRLVRAGGAEAVKVEGGRKRIRMIRAILDAEIPVMGHLGLTPQSVHAMGGYRVQGRDTAMAHELISDAVALADTGVFAVVLEGVPDTVAALITREVAVPTIGIGAGPSCDGQVLVFHDVLGLHDGHLPKFVRQYARLADTAVEALSQFFGDVDSGAFPAEAETYHMSEEAARMLLELEQAGDVWGRIPGDHLLADDAMDR
ncbi:MAG: 3-methyl-2-oxobutanoate hydroxymethyltransferase [Acidimicrobiia bacterium]